MYFIKGQSVAFQLSPVPGFGFSFGTLVRVLPEKRIQNTFNRKTKKRGHFWTQVAEVKTLNGEQRFVDVRGLKPVSLVLVS
jgi:hypothetical protein